MSTLSVGLKKQLTAEKAKTAELRRINKALRAEIRALKAEEWQRHPETWAEHVQTYPVRAAVAAAARKHGKGLGPTFCDLLVWRLREIDVSPDGSRLSLNTAARLVFGWSDEGQAKAVRAA